MVDRNGEVVVNWLVRLVVRVRGAAQRYFFERAVRRTETSQRKLLQSFLRKNRDTLFGREHGFADITSAEDYAQAVPIREFEEFRPWIERVEQGEKNVLTSLQPFMFSTTSGTTASPKLIPVTIQWIHNLGSLMRLWIYCNLLDHPGMLDGDIVSFVSPSIEGRTPGGIPVGSVSGLTYKRVPWVLRRKYPLPYELSEVEDYEDRYLMAARLAFARDVSIFAAPNPSTLLKLAEVGRANGELIIQAVEEGTLGVEPPKGEGDHAVQQRALYQIIASRLKPDPDRARMLKGLIAEHGDLLPCHCWPNLKVLGCWLGGSAGVQARRLRKFYGEVPRRDLGFRATEATMSLPMHDETPNGVLTVGTNFYEFIREEERGTENPAILLAHQLEEGGFYHILLTTCSGLYRYDINDVVEVRGFYGQAPIVAFIRKGRDMSNITGEKLHVGQVAAAYEQAESETGLTVSQIQMIPDAGASRYDLLVELEHDDTASLTDFVEALDSALCELNCEYIVKRKSGRLHLPQVHRMRAGWSARRQRDDVVCAGKRDSQYKWLMLAHAWDDATRSEVLMNLPAELIQAPPA